jgi:CBS domain containing-hemolysin-like protein
LRFIVQMLKPVIVGLNATANGTLRLFGIKPKAEVASAFTRDEVAGLVEESHREGLLTEEKEQLLAGTLQFDTRFARNIVIKMEDLVTIHVDTPLALAEDLVSRTGYSRLPVLREGNKFEGYVHIKDILNVPLSQHRKPLPKKAIRTLVEIYENDTLRTVLRTMQKAGTHMAVVKNEQGSSIGVATLEDAIEELVGEIRDASQKAV